MFTGIVEELGEILRQQHYRESSSLLIKGKVVMEGIREGDSIAVNGVCLTVTGFSRSAFYVDVMPETLRKTNLHQFKAGDKVNLERALPAGGRMGGHFVSGHIDATGKILTKKREGNAIVVHIGAPGEVMRYVIEKGSIAVDGVSLTAIDVQDSSFAISLIPHTAKLTTLGFKGPGDTVNLEADLLGKYIEKFVAGMLKGKNTSRVEKGISYSFLSENGFL